MKLISWNVNGLRAVLGKDFLSVAERLDADAICLQETKCQAGQVEVDLPGYHSYWNYAERKGYSGTAIFTRREPLSVSYGIGIPEHDREGRVITLTFPTHRLVTVYTPNSQDGLARLDYRMTWEDAFRAYVTGLTENGTVPVVICGDMNVAATEIDLKNPKSNLRSAGYTEEERGKFHALLASGFLDTFRTLYPDARDAYSWWSYRFRARERNAGWRIDYFLLSDFARNALKDAKIHADITGSDHCPVELDVEW